MSDQQTVVWSSTTHQSLTMHLQGWWAQDSWDLSKCPLVLNSTCPPEHFSPKLIEFKCKSPSLNSELKYGCWRKLEHKDWLPQRLFAANWLPLLTEWLNTTAPQVHSLMEYNLDKWLLLLRNYLFEQGLRHSTRSAYLDSSQNLRYSNLSSPVISAFRQIYLLVKDAYDQRPEYEREIWDLRRLGTVLNPVISDYKLNFTKLHQPWLLEAAKLFMRYSLASYSAGTCRRRLGALTPFSTFLKEQYPDLLPSALDRNVILQYAGYLTTTGTAATTRCHQLAHLRIFLELCSREDWVVVPKQRLIYDEDFPPQPRLEPRFIPLDVLAQLNEHLDAFPEPTRTMVYLLRECGMRLSELLALNLDCLEQDSKGDWFMRYYQFKMKKEHTITVSRQIVAIVQQQQSVVKAKWSSSVNMLFPNSKGRYFKERGFFKSLNRVCVAKDIRAANGQLFRFHAHQFRHTLATQMINNGVPQHIVQRFLGHESPEMTMRYAHIHDETLKQEYLRFQGRLVTVSGQVVESSDTQVNSGELQWLKKNILAQSLPNGYCALPVVAGPCPHANACLTCTHFRTDASFLPQHKDQLQETERILEVARANKWSRQVEINERVQTNLKRIVTSLEDEQERKGASSNATNHT